MPLAPLVPGSTAVYTATPTPPGATVPEVPAWTSSDALVAEVVSPNPDATGLTVTVNCLAPGSFTLTIAETLPGGNVIQGSITDTVEAPALTGFTIERTS